MAFVMSFSNVAAQPEGEPGFEDTKYWNRLCGGDEPLSHAQKQACQAFMQQQSGDLSQKIQDINNQRKEIAENIKEYAAKAKEYQHQADGLTENITSLTEQISVKEKEIEELEKKIKKTQKEVVEAQDKLKFRMVTTQSTMRLNPLLDILFGAKDFSDFVRIANGIRDITNHDEEFIENLGRKIKLLNKDKKKVQKDKENLAGSKKEVVDNQNQLLALKYEASVIEEEYRKKAAELEAQGNRYAAQIGEIQKRMKELAERGELNVAVSPGWTYPVPGAKISANTWAYASGGTHLGEDFAAPIGTPVLAVGNGVVINSVNGCANNGHLGNACGQQFGGSWGGGNQVYLLTKVNGGLYAVKYLHLNQGTPLAKGTIVSAGQQVAQVGNSGNTTGPHCHIEVFYLGAADRFSNYAMNWNGDLAFGCGWGSAALNRRCENGVGAPCRIRPESVFGG